MGSAKSARRMKEDFDVSMMRGFYRALIILTVSQTLVGVSSNPARHMNGTPYIWCFDLHVAPTPGLGWPNSARHMKDDFDDFDVVMVR